jgi:hypothetical protein
MVAQGDNQQSMKPMSQKEAEEWTKKHYPRHIAARKRQVATRERSEQRKEAAASQPRPMTKRRAAEQKAIQLRLAKRAARHEKRARKTQTV